jgi:Zn-dependent M28 family amino/carboxypeptidase
MQATAVAALIYNDGTAPDRQEPFTGSMSGVISTIPVFGLSYTLGSSLSEIEGLLMALSVNTVGGNQTTMNVIAETTYGSSQNVILVGSHLDSVPAGPGINDNGSGSSVNLELALALAKLKMKTVNKIRFAWWAAEEMGLLGSKYYVSQLSAEDKADIALNINMDMVGSPNYFIGIYNGSMANETIRAACITIQDLFEEAFDNRDLPYELTPFNGRSDYGPFIEASIPAGGLFTGAEEIKTAESRHTFGGVANAAYDPCYHQTCDTDDKNNTEVLEDMSQALGYVVQTLAMQKDLRSYLNEP